MLQGFENWFICICTFHIQPSNLHAPFSNIIHTPPHTLIRPIRRAPQPQPPLLIPRRILLQDLGVPMYTRHHSHADTPPDRLRYPPLIFWSQAGLVTMSNTSHRCHVLGHDAEILNIPIINTCT